MSAKFDALGSNLQVHECKRGESKNIEGLRCTQILFRVFQRLKSISGLFLVNCVVVEMKFLGLLLLKLQV